MRLVMLMTPELESKSSKWNRKNRIVLFTVSQLMFTVNSYLKVTSVVYMLAPVRSIPNECSRTCSNQIKWSFQYCHDPKCIKTFSNLQCSNTSFDSTDTDQEKTIFANTSKTNGPIKRLNFIQSQIPHQKWSNRKLGSKISCFIWIQQQNTKQSVIKQQ